MEIKLEEKTKKALLWIIKILNKHDIPFQISGGFAAKLYGSPRPLNDIDIDMPEERFDEIINDVKKYITYGPEQYVNEKWDLLVLTLDYFGQEIDLSGSKTTKIFDSKNKKWLTFSSDLSKVVWITVDGIKVPVMPKKDLIAYKIYLGGKHQLIDIDAVKNSK